MSISRIVVDGVTGSYVEVQIGSTVSIDNSGDGSELSILWVALTGSQPSGSYDGFANSEVFNTTITPSKEGTYILHNIVDGILTGSVAMVVRHLKSDIRSPAAGEKTHESGSYGWARALQNINDRLDDIVADSGTTVGFAKTGLNRGQIVRPSGSSLLKTGLPGEERLVDFASISGEATGSFESTLYIVEGPVTGDPTSNVTSGSLFTARLFGLFGPLTGTSPTLGSDVWIRSDGVVSLSVGNPDRKIGTVIDTAGSAYYINFDGSSDEKLAGLPAHTLAGDKHTADTLANLNTKVSDATLIDTGDSRLSDARTPTSHNLGGAEHAADTLANLNLKISDATIVDTGDSRFSDARTPTAHNLGGAEHSADTLANLNLKVSDATLIDTGDSRLSDARTPTAHNLGGAEHSADTLANLNLKVSDATLIDTGDSRLSDERVANSLATTGAAVEIDKAVPPTAGQVLEATSATTASWVTPASAPEIQYNDVTMTTSGSILNFSGSSVDDIFNVGADVTTIQVSRFPPNHIDGLRTSYTSTTVVGIAVGTCRDSTDAFDIRVTSALTATITTSGANGLDTGTEAGSTWYALYVIIKDSDGTAASLLSTSFTSPTMPSGYTYFRRVGAVRNNSTNNFRKFYETGTGATRTIYYDDYNGSGNALTNGRSATYASVSCAAFAPTGTTSIDFQHRYLSNVSAVHEFALTYPGATDAMFHFTTGIISTNYSHGRTGFVQCNTSQAVEYKLTAAGSSNYQLDLWVLGYRDEL